MDRNERREFIKQAAIEAMVGILINDQPSTIEDHCILAASYAVQLAKEVESALNAESV